jgi:hypothetical protein
VQLHKAVAENEQQTGKINYQQKHLKNLQNHAPNIGRMGQSCG